MLESGGVSLDKSGGVRVGIRSGDGFGSEWWCWDLEDAIAVVAVVVAAAHAVADITSWGVHRRW